MSSIRIIGPGNMAGALADRALAGGNAVEIIGRDPAKAKKLAAAFGGATVGTAGAAPAGDIVVLAVPFADAAAVVSEYGDALHGKAIIDITNPVAPDFQGFVTPEGSSGAQAKTRVSAFIESLGLRPMDNGRLEMARALENVALMQLGLVAHSVKHTNFFLGVSILG
ncbi:NADPH-dependent F420 reductase [Streptomyces adonidis]|uniref:NADPH-dependent F420 reductase n=1 Tax=Streptomyces adonidis TaxID=3231367 RepID=UPI0034DB68AE